MKPLATYFIFLLFLSNCAERRVLRKIHGLWKIDSILYTDNGITGDILVPTSYLQFDRCSAREDQNSVCKVYYRRGKEEFSFIFQAVDGDHPDYSLVIRLDNMPRRDSAFFTAGKEVLGKYTVSFTRKGAILTCKDCAVSALGRTGYTSRTITLSETDD